MPRPDRMAPGTPRQWMARAKSSYILATTPKASEVRWEDLCFEAQQAAEKAIKAVLQHRKIVFPYVHDLQNLLELLVAKGVEVPEGVKRAAVLSRYAFQTRYPGDYVPVMEEDYRKAMDQAKVVLNWAERTIDGDVI